MKKVLEITVKLKKRQNELIPSHPERSEGSLSYEFHTKEIPIENRVNEALIKILLKNFPEFKTARIIRGLRSKRKLVELS